MIWACLKIKDVPKNGDFEGTIKLLEDPSSSQRVAIPPRAESLAQRLQSRQPEEPEAGDGCYSQWHPEISWKTGCFMGMATYGNHRHQSYKSCSATAHMNKCNDK